MSHIPPARFAALRTAIGTARRVTPELLAKAQAAVGEPVTEQQLSAWLRLDDAVAAVEGLRGATSAPVPSGRAQPMRSALQTRLGIAGARAPGRGSGALGQALVARRRLLALAVAASALVGPLAHAQVATAAGTAPQAAAQQQAPIARVAAAAQNAAGVVAASWKKGTQVYLAAGVTLSPAKAQQLADGLRPYPHWTVVVMNSGSETQANKDNVKTQTERLNSAFLNNAAFTDKAAAGEAIGNILVWDEGARRVEFAGSERNDRLQLSEDQWDKNGPLFQPFVHEMRSSGDGVKGLIRAVENIETQMAAALAKDAVQQQAQLRQLHGRVQNAVERSGFGGAVLSPLTVQVDQALALFAAKPQQAAVAARQLLPQLQALQNEVTAFAGAPQRLLDAESRLQALRGEPHVAVTDLNAADAAYEAARIVVRERKPGAKAKLDAVENAIAHATAQAHAAAQHERNIERLKTGAGLVLALAGLAGVGVQVRRRAGAKEQTLGALNDVAQKLAAQGEALKAAQARLQKDGPLPAEQLQALEGATRALLQQTFDALKTAVSAHGNALAFVDEVRAELGRHPFKNLLSATHYHAAMARLNAPVSAEAPLPAEAWLASLWEAATAQVPARASLATLLGGWLNTQVQTISAAADSLDRSAADVAARQQTQQAEGQRLQAQLGAATQQVFVPSIVQPLLERAEALAKQALSQAAKDPVGATKGPLLGAQQLHTHANALIGLCETAEAAVPDRQQRAQAALTAAGFDASWLLPRVTQVQQALAQAAQQLVASPNSAAPVQAASASVQAATTDFEQAARLAAVLGKAGPQPLTQMASAIEAARTQLARVAGVAVAQVFSDTQVAPPQTHQQRAQQAADAARAALARGDVAQAEQQWQACTQHLSAAQAAIDASTQAVAGFAATNTQLGAQLAQAKTLQQELVTLMGELQQKYVAALVPQVDPSAIAAAIGRSEAAWQAAKTAHNQGAFLDGAAQLAAVASACTGIVAQHQQVVRQKRDLAEQTSANQTRSTQLQSDLARLMQQDRRLARAATTQAFTNAEQALAQAAAALKQQPEDPKATSATLDAAAQALTDARSALAHDQEAYREASAQMKQAEREVSSARRWSGRKVSSVSGLYGSTELARAQQQLQAGQYEDALATAKRAQSEAQSAISSAESDDRRRVQAEEDEARRKADASTQSSGGSGFSSGGGGDFGGGGAGGSYGSPSGSGDY